MYRSAIVLGLYLSFAIAVGAACSPGQPAVPEDDTLGSGGTGQQSGGSSGTGTSGGTNGGSVSAGGAGGSVTTGGAGGSVTTGGAGGTVSTGGTVGGAGRAAGGSAGVGTGGTVAGGGRAATGGTGGTTGGTVGTTGGSAGTGSSTGGSAGTGTGVSCDAAWAVTMDGFVRMPAKGACWSGYAFGGGDATSTVTPKDFSKSMGILKMSGTVGAAVDPDYLGNVYFGFNLNQKSGSSAKATIVPTGTGITITCTGCGTPPMRAQLKGAKEWCAPLTSGVAIPYATFKTECWEGGVTQTPYAKEAIEAIQITVPGGAADAAFDFTLTTVTEN